jgi:hypothetical protein
MTGYSEDFSVWPRVSSTTSPLQTPSKSYANLIRESLDVSVLHPRLTASITSISELSYRSPELLVKFTEVVKKCNLRAIGEGANLS